MYQEIRNIDKVPKEERDNLRYLVREMDEVLVAGGAGSMIRSFFFDCIDGQIIRSLMPRKSKEKYYNKLSDFYIDSRVGFRGRRDVDYILTQLKELFIKITKFRPQRFHIGDTVRIKNPPPSNAWLKGQPNTWGKTAKVKKLAERELGSLDYEGMYIQFNNKGNWIYVGSNDVTKVKSGSGRPLKLLAGYFKAHPLGHDLYALEIKYQRGGFKRKPGTYRLQSIENGEYTFVSSNVKTPVHGGSGEI